MTPVSPRQIVTVRRSLRDVATTLPVDTLPPAPDGATHDWLLPHGDLVKVDPARDQFLWFQLPWHALNASASMWEVRAELADVAHRLAANDGYTGPLHLFLEPFLDVTYSVLAFPTEPLPEACG